MWKIEKLSDQATAILKIDSDRKLKEIQDLQDQRDYQLFDYVHRLIRNLEIFNTEFAPTPRKSNETSDNLRKQGEELLPDRSKWKTVMELFTMSIAFAQPGSEILALAYSDRSQGFFEQHLYRECVRDIARALNCNPSNDLKEELELRRQQVEEFREFHKTLDYHGPVPRLPGSRNKRIRCASRAIGFETNEKWGEHIIAKKDINIGEVLVLEEPYISDLSLSERFFHCHECLELCYDLIPCPNCTEVMYCSDVCRVIASQEYHKYECILFQHDLKVHKIFLKLALKALINYDNSLEGMSIDETPTFQSNCYKYVASINIFKERMSPEDLFLGVLEPVAFYHFLTTYTSILEDLNCDNRETVLKEILVRNSLLATNNQQPIRKFILKKGSVPSHLVIGYGIYPFYSNIHHSCFCNTVMIYYGRKLVIYATENIKKGKQVTTNYGTSFFNYVKEKREEVLAGYYLTCQCPACEYDWPLRDYLRPGTPVPKTLQIKITQFITSGLKDRSVGKKMLEEAYKFHNDLKITEMPSSNYLLLRELILYVLSIMGNTTIDEE